MNRNEECRARCRTSRSASLIPHSSFLIYLRLFSNLSSFVRADKAAFAIMTDTTSIWTGFSRHLRRYLVQRVKCKQDADDLLQEIFIKIHLKLPTLSKQESLPAWVWQITRNTLLDYYKQKRLPVVEIEQAVTQSADLSPAEFNQWMADCVRPFLELLPEHHKEALQLADLQNISQKELAQQWNIGYSGAKSRVQRARTELYGLFTQCCQIEADKYGNLMQVACLEKTC